MNVATKVENSKLAVWQSLATTDPAHTKQFQRSGGFRGTALKPMWVWQRLTEEFGPFGEGWGCGKPDFQIVPADNELLVFCTVQGWHGSPENMLWGVGGDKVVSVTQRGPKADDEAFKKAFTDALMNAFKFLGAGADIHMGLFDDNKYVAEAAAHFANDEPARDEPAPREKLEGKHSSKTALKAALQTYVTKITNANSVREVDAIVKDFAADLQQGERYLPLWMNGDPSKDSKGLTRMTNERRDLLTLADGLRDCRTVKERDNWMAANEHHVDALDDLLRRQFDKIFEDHDDAIKLVDRVTAGA